MKKSKIQAPECGSIEKNKMIRAINAGKENPCKDNKECIEYWNELQKEINEYLGVYFSLVEPDDYEEQLLRSLIP